MMIAIAAVVAIIVLFVLYRKSPRFRQLVEFALNPITIVLKAEQESFIRDLHPKYQGVFRRFIADVEATGWSVIITSGYRSFARQAELRAQDSRNGQPGLSLHNYGLAIDINAQKGTTWLRKRSSKAAWEASGIVKIAERYGLRWGGNFSGYHDPVHFDTGQRGADLLAIARQQFGSNPANIQGNKIRI
jgi:hypothetical protein